MPSGCVFLTGSGMTVTTVQSVRVVQLNTGYGLEVVLTPADTGKFAALTRQLAGLPSPRDQLAIFIDGRVIADSAVQGPITGGTAQIPGFATRAQAESLLSYLRNR
jgi:preprotein translocase subunit SecD